MEEITLTLEQTIVLIAILLPLGIILWSRPIRIEIERPVVEEKAPERDLRYLQIKRYYGG